MVVHGHVEAKVGIGLPTVSVRGAILEALSVLSIELNTARTNGTEVTVELRTWIDVAIATREIVDQFVETARVLIGAAHGRIDAHARGPDVRRRTVQFALAVLRIEDEVLGVASRSSVVLGCACVTRGLVRRALAAPKTTADQNRDYPSNTHAYLFLWKCKNRVI